MGEPDNHGKLILFAGASYRNGRNKLKATLLNHNTKSTAWLDVLNWVVQFQDASVLNRDALTHAHVCCLVAHMQYVCTVQYRVFISLPMDMKNLNTNQYLVYFLEVSSFKNWILFWFM